MIISLPKLSVGLLGLIALSLSLVLAWNEGAPAQGMGKQEAILIMAAGDIACDPQSQYFNNGKGQPGNCQMQATADLVRQAKPKVVLALGDNQYERGELENFKRSYEPTWGRFKAITKPVPGNHEYYSDGAKGYYDYFGPLAGDRNKGYYSFDLGQWHLIALNSNCKAIGGCGAGSPQEKWLQADLKKNTKACTLAFWHHPRYSSGVHGNNAEMETFWQDLYNAKADVVLTAHDHLYERFAPQGPGGKLDEKLGLREFVVGSGGKSLYPFKTLRANSEVRIDNTYGVLKLALGAKGYDWEFLPTVASQPRDKGQALCH
ncbi:metallophosphoesterase [Synechocystis sp. LKSZ1]|uniref:metallophosphoesterase family protein n=1 Tax=Synechocystis sp. LKSZ1 TaxID=3144951 RepID=UPI00336BF000